MTEDGVSARQGISVKRSAERLFNHPRLYRAKFVVTGAALRLVRPLIFKSMVTMEDVIAAARIPEGSRVCELGCGDGENYRVVSKLSGDVDFTGVDINSAMTDHCAQMHPRQRWLCTTMPYPFADREFDYCVIVNLLHHLNSRAEVLEMLAEARRIATTILLFEPLQSENSALRAVKNVYWLLSDGGSRYLRLDEFHRLFEEAGLLVRWERHSSPLRHFYGAHLTAGSRSDP